ncbi:MAG TPA: sugar ABC transporter substrate-binding protein [Methanospirillum sp.]|nr:sugar ABC transporter substrate-binding protein [Methanospirillum sp.]
MISYRLRLGVLVWLLLILLPSPILGESGSLGDLNISIGIIPSGSSSPFHQELINSANQSAVERGWKTIILPPDTEENITAQKAAMQILIRDRVSAIALNALNPSELSAEISAAGAAGIPVLLYNTLSPVQGVNITGYIGYNQYDGAAEMGSYASRLLADKKNESVGTVLGKVFILRGLPGFHANQRTDGFKAGLAQSPGINVIGEEIAGWDRETARKIASDALKADPDIEIMYGNSDEMAIGAALAAQEQGKQINSDIFILGVDGNSPTLDMIQNGTVTATLGVYPDLMGETVIDQIERLLKGESIAEYLETPAFVVDSRQRDAYMNRSTWTDPTDSGPEILK